MFGRYFRVLCLLICFVVCFGAGAAYYKYVGFPATLAFFKAPLARARILRRDWTAPEQLQYTLDQGGAYSPRYVETSFLPLVINEKRLSDSYPVAKFGGAITLVDEAVVIMDRLGAIYRYDLRTGSFGKLRLPPLPNNLEVYLHQRPGLGGVEHANLAGPEAQMEFRAHDITFLQDRKELAAVYDQFDEALGKLRTVVSVIPIDVATLAATGDWQTIYTSETFTPGNAAFSGGRMAYRGSDKLYLSIGDHATYNPQVSQNSNTAFGKIIELNLVSKKWREVSKGLRNTEGLTFVKSGQLIAVDNGPRGGDDLDIITDGDNYGWPRVSLGTTYDSYDFTGGSFSVGVDRGSQRVRAAWPSASRTSPRPANRPAGPGHPRASGNAPSTISWLSLPRANRCRSRTSRPKVSIAREHDVRTSGPETTDTRRAVAQIFIGEFQIIPCRVVQAG